jgi:hypothetical protein
MAREAKLTPDEKRRELAYEIILFDTRVRAHPFVTEDTLRTSAYLEGGLDTALDALIADGRIEVGRLPGGAPVYRPTGATPAHAPSVEVAPEDLPVAPVAPTPLPSQQDRQSLTPTPLPLPPPAPAAPAPEPEKKAWSLEAWVAGTKAEGEEEEVSFDPPAVP